MNNKGTTKPVNNKNLTTIDLCPGDESLTRKQLLEKLKMLTELLKNRDGDAILQGSHGIRISENKDEA